MKNIVLKIEQYVFWFFLIAIPFQIRLILYSPSWYFNEYTSFAIYGTDILLVVLIFLWIIGKKSISFSRPTASSVVLGIFVVIAGCSLVGTLDSSVGWYRLGKLFEGILFYYYMRHRSWEISSLPAMLLALGVGGAFQSLVGITQFIKQADIGLRYLGESVLGNNLRGVAVFFDQAGERVMRAYGTTPHPNILATYLLLALSSLYVVYFRYIDYLRKWQWHTLYALILVGLFATFSRTVILSWVLLFGGGVFFWLWYFRDQWKKLFPVGITTIIVGSLFALVFWGSIIGRLTINPTDEAIVLRQYYNSQALQSHQYINLGLGIGNFVPWLMKYQPGLPRELYQPAHNVYLLIYAELGILGVGAFVAWITFLIIEFFRSIKFDASHVVILGMCISLVFIGLFDHFFWTLQQGILTWWGVAGLVAHYAKSR